MAYVAVRGGQKAIKEALKLLRYYRLQGGDTPIEVSQIMSQMRLAVDKAMGEGSLYDPKLAALALKQAEGDTIEASFLLRAFRSTLPRNLYSLPIDTSNIDIVRRISATFKDVPGGQYLGPTRDYSRRLLQMELLEEREEQVRAYVEAYLGEAAVAGEVASEVTMAVASEGGGEIAVAGEAQPHAEGGKVAGSHPDAELLPSFPRVIDLLRQEGLLAISDAEPAALADQGLPDEVNDITRTALQLPASRAVRMQSMARGETGALLALAYSSARGYGDVHPTIGELRVGYVPVVIPHPLYEGETICIGRVLVTEAEIVVRVDHGNEESQEGAKTARFGVGYGLCFGHNEDKVIAMGILDTTMKAANPGTPAEDEEFVLYHIDGIESSGFISHFKLPHYVDFQAELQRVRSINSREEEQTS